MKKTIGKSPAIFPMPVLMVAAYDENGKPDVMNAAWGQQSTGDKIALFISERHKTVKNIRESKAFTVALADKEHMTEADYVGIDSGNDVEDKFEKSGLHAVKSEHVNAPVIEEFPVVMECELEEIVETDSTHVVIGKVVNTQADESVLNEDGKIDVKKFNPILFNTYDAGYYEVGSRVGQAWGEGKKLQ